MVILELKINWVVTGYVKAEVLVLTGKDWIASLTYAHSPDKFGWDKDLYDKE
jgi:hypothetical protein